MNSLHVRLIISHILPLAVAVPLIGVALVYLLESQVLLTNLSADLEQRAATIARTTVDQIDIWYDKENAQAFVRRVSSTLKTPVMLLDPKGDILASSDPADLQRNEKLLNLPGLEQALAGKTSIQLHYPKLLRPEFADIFMPVVNPKGEVVGVIRLKDQLEGFQDRFTQLRTLIAWVIGVGLLMGILLGWGLAFSLERSLARTTAAITKLSEKSIEQGFSEGIQTLKEEGPNEIRLLIRAFNLMTEKLQTLEVSRRRLLANLVHELGRPLGAMHSAIQALEGGADEDIKLRQELLKGIDNEINRLRRLIDDLAKLYHQPLGPHDLDLKPLNMNEWLPTLLAPWREAAQAKRITWEADISPSLPLILADSDRLAQALGNLLSNAVKYTSNGGKIHISCYNGEGVSFSSVQVNDSTPTELLHLNFIITNSGKPLPPEEQNKIFLPFYRGNNTTRFPQGMGLGLTIARDIILAHQGTLAVESNKEFGNRFIVSLPVYNTAEKITSN